MDRWKHESDELLAELENLCGKKWVKKIMEKAVKTDMEYREILEKSLSAIQYLRMHGFSTYMESEGIINRIMMFKDKNEMRDQKIINIK